MNPQDIVSPPSKDALLALLQARRLPEARALGEALCREQPQDAEAWHLLGVVHGSLGEIQAAEACFRKAIELRPKLAEAHSNLAGLLEAQGRLEEAAESYRTGLKLNLRHVLARQRLANLLTRQGRYAEAEAEYREVVRLQPDSIGAYLGLARALYELDRPNEAIGCLKNLLASKPNCAEAYINLGPLLAEHGDISEAVACSEKAVALSPKNSLAHNNLGNIYGIQGRYDDEISCYERALQLKPDYLECHYSLAAIHLALGRFARGWPHYAYRPLKGTTYSTSVALPRDLNGRRLLVVRNQGLGDEIFFLRFVPQLKARGAWVAYRPDPRLGSMLSRVEGIDRLVASDEALEAVDYTFSVGDLPLLLGMDHASKVPPPLPLIPLPERVEALRERLTALGPPPYIGVTWRAGKKEKRKLYKETPKEHLAEALRGLPGTVVILQRHPQAGEIETFSRALGRPAHDLSAVNEDLEDMLALLSLMDEYVGVSNTNMHLRAGLGRTARVLVPHPPEWRWMAEGEESPWFRGFAVYRQGLDRDWGRAFGRLRKDLVAGLTGNP